MTATSRHSAESIKRSLRIKLARLVAAVVLFTAGALILGGFLSLRGILREQAQVRLQTELTGRQRLLDAYIRQQFERVKLVASRTQLRRLLRQHVDGAVDLADVAERSTRILTDARDSTDTFIDIWITDPKGKVITSTNLQRMGESFADHEAFLGGREEPAMLPPRSNQSIHRSIVAAPVISTDDVFLGVVMVTLDVSDMHDMLRADLLESQTTRVMVGMQSNGSIELFFAPEGEATTFKPATIPALAAAVSGKTGFEQFVDYKGNDVLAAFAPVGYGGWGVAVKIDVDEAYAPIKTLRMWSLLIAIIVLIVAVSLALLTAGRFARPIRRLTNAASALADGDYSARAEIDSDDELGVLGQVFNDTAAALQKHREHLEELVQQRTTELQASIEQLEDSRAIFRSLVEGLPLHIFRKDVDGRFMFCNERFAGSMDRTVEEVIGKTDYDFFPSEQADKYRADDQRVMTMQTTFHDIEAHHEHGQLHYVEVVKSPVYDHRHQVVGVQGAFWDVTDRKRAQEAIAASQALTRQIIDTALDAFVAMDARGEIVDWNPQAEKIFGWAREEVEGRKLSETLIPERFRADHERGLATFLDTGAGPVLNQRIELVALHKAGHEFPIELTIAAIPVNDSYRFNAFVHDISVRRRHVQELQETQEQLQGAKDAAEFANQAKSDFLANMSHEIRTPMNGVLGMIELMMNTETSPEQREYLRLAKGSAEALLNILNDILDFSKIDAGKMELDMHPFHLRDSVGDTLQTLTLRAAEKGLELALRIPSAVPDRLIGDQGRFRQIIINLVGNAIKFTDSGEVVVDISLKDADDERALLHMSVSDTGIGISKEKHDAVFESFAQADSSTTREFGGTGLGLAICRQLVELMGGRIWMDSEIGKGSTFHVEIPFDLGDRDAHYVLPTPEELKGLPVLVVDDNATNRLILEEMLLSWRMHPIVAPDAKTALQRIDQTSDTDPEVRLALLDGMMPTMDGLTLAEKIRERPACAALPLLLLSSGTRPDDVTRARSLGIARCLPKPVKPSDLLDAMVLALRRKKPMDASGSDEPDAGRPKRLLNVLLAEDTRVNQQVAVRLLEKRGHRVTVADNGKLAVSCFGEQPFDAVLMDVQMPEMDGLEATAAIRAVEKPAGGHVPIIAMTAHAMKDDRQRCLDAGMDDYLSKPIHADELYDVLERNAGDTPDDQSSSQDRPRSELVNQTSDSTDGDDQFHMADAMAHVGNDETLLRELAGIFLDDIQPMMQQLGVAIDREDPIEARRLAHAVKGLSVNFGAANACQNAVSIESLAKVENWSAIGAHWHSLQEQITTLIDELQRWTQTKEG